MEPPGRSSLYLDDDYEEWEEDEGAAAEETQPDDGSDDIFQPRPVDTVPNEDDMNDEVMKQNNSENLAESLQENQDKPEMGGIDSTNSGASATYNIAMTEPVEVNDVSSNAKSAADVVPGSGGDDCGDEKFGNGHVETKQVLSETNQGDGNMLGDAMSVDDGAGEFFDARDEMTPATSTSTSSTPQLEDVMQQQHPDIFETNAPQPEDVEQQQEQQPDVVETIAPQPEDVTPPPQQQQQEQPNDIENNTPQPEVAPEPQQQPDIVEANAVLVATVGLDNTSMTSGVGGSSDRRMGLQQSVADSSSSQQWESNNSLGGNSALSRGVHQYYPTRTTATAAGAPMYASFPPHGLQQQQHQSSTSSVATTHTRFSTASGRSMNQPMPPNLNFKDQVRDVEVIEPITVHVVVDNQQQQQPMTVPSYASASSSQLQRHSVDTAAATAPLDALPVQSSSYHPAPSVTTHAAAAAALAAVPRSHDSQLQPTTTTAATAAAAPSRSMASMQHRYSDAALAEAAASTRSSSSSEVDSVSQLIKEGFPVGLAQELQKSKLLFPLRLWVVDNSGSMLNSDCTRVVEMEGGKVDVIKCNRWSELQSTVQRQAHLACIVQATTSFRLLNKSRLPGAIHEFTIHNLPSEVEHANAVMSAAKPDGVTPITEHIVEIHDRIAAMENDLVTNGQKVVVVIATDGIPTDKYGESPVEVLSAFAEALKRLQTLPVWIVLRLCTTEKDVIKFYRKMDGQLERPLECISNYTNEGKEVRTCNAWLNYALPLHRCREMGYHHRLFDLLDERELTIEELHEFLTVLFGPSALASVPDIHADWKGFVAALTTIVRNEGRQWCPHTKKPEEWIDLRKLNAIYGGGMLGSIRRKVSDMKIGAKSS